MRAALRLIWGLNARQLVTHRARMVLSVLGIAVGVMLVVGVGTLSASVTGSLEAIAQAAATEANVEIRPNGDTGLRQDVMSSVRETEDVEHVGGTVESNVRLRSGRAEARVVLLGIDLGILELSPQSVDPAQFAGSDPRGVFLPAGVASELGVRVGDRVELTTPAGWRTVPVGFVLESADQARSRVAVGTIAVVRQLLDRGETYDAIYVKASDVESTTARLQAAVGPRATVGPIAFRGRQVRQLLASAEASFSIGMIIALFVGAFLVYNTMSMAAVERLKEAAVLRAVGATRRQVFALFCAQGVLLGVVGSALGVGGGLLLSRQILLERGGALEEIYPVQITQVAVEPSVLVLAAVAGVLASFVAAMLPARRVAHSDPALMLGATGALEDPLRDARRAVVTVGAACLVVGPVMSFSAPSGTTVGTLGGVITLAGIGLLIPVTIPYFATGLVRRLARLRRVSGAVRLGAEEILRSPGRTAYTIGAVVLSLSLVVAFGIALSSVTNAFNSQAGSLIAADLYVRSPTWRPLGSDVRLDDRLASEIETIDGVAAAWPFRVMPTTHNDRSILVIAYDLEEFARFARLDGADEAEAKRNAQLATDGPNVLVSPSAFPEFDYAIGDTVAMDTPTGRHQLRIVGTVDNPVAIVPEFNLDYTTFVRLWGSAGADTFGAVVKDGVDEHAVRAELTSRFGAAYGIEVDTNEQYLDRIAGAVNSVQQLVASVQLVAVLVAGLGLANTLLISTLERKRELGVLRAVGTLRRQLRRMVVTEALVMAVIGVGLAWTTGTVIGAGMYRVIRAQIGLDFPIVIPPSVYAAAAVLGLATAFFASLLPAARAARINVVEALQYE